MDFRYRNTGIIKEGKRIYDDPSLHSRFIASLEGKKFEEFTRELKAPPSSQQRAFYVGVVLKEAHRHEQFNHYNNPKDIHDLVMAPLFLSYYDSAGLQRIKKLSELDEQEMWDLTERVIAYLASEFGVIIADKDKYYIK